MAPLRPLGSSLSPLDADSQPATSMPPPPQPDPSREPSLPLLAPRNPPKHDEDVSARKQSKSRNGIATHGPPAISLVSLPSPLSSAAADHFLSRLYHLQEQAHEMRRDQALLPAMCSSQSHLRGLSQTLQMEAHGPGEKRACRNPR